MANLYIPPGCITARQAADALGITTSGLRDLVHRRRLTRAGGTPRHPYYRALDIAALMRPDDIADTLTTAAA